MLCTGSRFDSCRSSPIYMFINVCHGSYQHQSCGTKCSHPPIMQQSLVPQQVHTPPPGFSLWKPTIIKGYKVKYPLLFVVCTAYVFLLLKSMTNPSLPVRHRPNLRAFLSQPTICLTLVHFSCSQPYAQDGMIRAMIPHRLQARCNASHVVSRWDSTRFRIGLCLVRAEQDRRPVRSIQMGTLRLPGVPCSTISANINKMFSLFTTKLLVNYFVPKY
jgi:hypothetical protein